MDGARRESDLLQHVLHRSAVKSVPREAARGAVEDLPPTGIEVFLGYTGHGANLKRTFILTARASAEWWAVINERSFSLNRGTSMPAAPNRRMVAVILLIPAVVAIAPWAFA